MAFIAQPVRDASWLHPKRSTMRIQGAAAGPVPIISSTGGMPWSKSRMRAGGRFGYEGYGLFPLWGGQVYTEPLDYKSPYTTRGMHTYRGYSGVGYVSPDVLKKPMNWGAVGVGVGVFSAATAASMAVHGLMHKGATPGWKGSLPAILPSLGAGFIAYLLRWKLDKLCECKEPGFVTMEPVAGEMPTRTSPERPTVPARPRCPEYTTYNPETGRCEAGLI